MLIDEADTVLLDHAATLPNKFVLGLTATVVSQDLRTETAFLKHCKFASVDSKIEGYIDHHTAAAVASIRDFMNVSAAYAKLVYVRGEATIETFKIQAATEATLTDCNDLARLKKLSKEDIVVVTDPTLMRGVDYRVCKDATDTIGISLLVMARFDTQRSYVQGLGRVGRYDERSLRFLWDQLGEPVDKFKEMAILARLKMAIERRKPGKNNPVQQKLAFEERKK